MLFGILNQTIFIILVLIGVTLGKKNDTLNQTTVTVNKKVKDNGDLKQFSATCCDSRPCQNGGTCYAVGTGYFCSCPFGITGNNCQIGKFNFFL